MSHLDKLVLLNAFFDCLCSTSVLHNSSTCDNFGVPPEPDPIAIRDKTINLNKRINIQVFGNPGHYKKGLLGHTHLKQEKNEACPGNPFLPFYAEWNLIERCNEKWQILVIFVSVCISLQGFYRYFGDIPTEEEEQEKALLWVNIVHTLKVRYGALRSFQDTQYPAWPG